MPAASSPADTFSDLIRKANQLRREGRHEQAASAYFDAAAANGDDRHALLFRAISYKDAQMQNEACDAYDYLLRLHPDDAEGWSLYGTQLKRYGKNEEAIVALKASLKLRSDIDTRNVLVTVLTKTGRTNEARLQGLRNLIEKDKDALDRFNRKTAKPALRSDRPQRPFDPRHRARNIIAFSLWGDNPVYVHGAIENARIAPHLYYGWRARFYHDDSVPADAVRELQRAGAQTIRVADPKLMRIKPMWRFFASDDPEIDYFICRDADSRLNPQELLAVTDWVRSGKPFHIMRDHLYHMELILAGMWGARAGFLPSVEETLITMPEYFDNKFADQAYLKNEVWPLIRDDNLTHDSWYHFHNGKDFPEAYRLPYPIHVGGGIKTMPHWRDSKE